MHLCSYRLRSVARNATRFFFHDGYFFLFFPCSLLLLRRRPHHPSILPYSLFTPRNACRIYIVRIEHSSFFLLRNTKRDEVASTHARSCPRSLSRRMPRKVEVYVACQHCSASAETRTPTGCMRLNASLAVVVVVVGRRRSRRRRWIADNSLHVHLRKEQIEFLPAYSD